MTVATPTLLCRSLVQYRWMTNYLKDSTSRSLSSAPRAPDAVSCKAPHNPWMPANMSSKSPVIVRVMEMPAIDLQHCDAIQSWLSIGPPRSRCHYQDVRAIQSPQGLVQSGLNSRSARMVKSSGSLRGIHRRGRV